MSNNPRLIYRTNVTYPIATLTPTKTYRVYADHLDTSRRVATNDNEATIVWKWEGKPFGESEATGILSFNLRFPGQYFDNETKTHYNINRDYNPVTGRYIQSDPTGLKGGVNGFVYVEGKPIVAVDLEGLVIQVDAKYSSLLWTAINSVTQCTQTQSYIWDIMYSTTTVYYKFPKNLSEYENQAHFHGGGVYEPKDKTVYFADYMKTPNQQSSYYSYGSIWSRGYRYYTLAEIITHESYHAWEDLNGKLSKGSAAESRAIWATNKYRDCHGYPHR